MTGCYNLHTMQTPIIVDSLLTGIIQGTTELLPISSTGHLLLFTSITGSSLAMSEIAVLHLGTLGSICIAMRDKLRQYASLSFLTKIAVAFIPAGIIGFLFEDSIDRHLGSPISIALSLALWGFVMLLTDFKSQRNSHFKTHALGEISILQSLLVGLAQVVALIPGTSRSGITTLAGIWSGMTPEVALSFSFLSGIPLLAGSGAYGVYKLTQHETGIDASSSMIILALLTALIVGILTAYVLKKRISKGILTICGIYRIIIGIALVASILF